MSSSTRPWNLGERSSCLLPRREDNSDDDDDGDSCGCLGLASWEAAASIAMGDCWKPARGDLLL